MTCMAWHCIGIALYLWSRDDVPPPLLKEDLIYLFNNSIFQKPLKECNKRLSSVDSTVDKFLLNLLIV